MAANTDLQITVRANATEVKKIFEDLGKAAEGAADSTKEATEAVEKNTKAQKENAEGVNETAESTKTATEASEELADAKKKEAKASKEAGKAASTGGEQTAEAAEKAGKKHGALGNIVGTVKEKFSSMWKTTKDGSNMVGELASGLAGKFVGVGAAVNGVIAIVQRISKAIDDYNAKVHEANMASIKDPLEAARSVAESLNLQMDYYIKKLDLANLKTGMENANEQTDISLSMLEAKSRNAMDRAAALAAGSPYDSASINAEYDQKLNDEIRSITERQNALERKKVEDEIARLESENAGIDMELAGLNRQKRMSQDAFNEATDLANENEPGFWASVWGPYGNRKMKEYQDYVDAQGEAMKARDEASAGIRDKEQEKKKNDETIADLRKKLEEGGELDRKAALALEEAVSSATGPVLEVAQAQSDAAERQREAMAAANANIMAIQNEINGLSALASAAAQNVEYFNQRGREDERVLEAASQIADNISMGRKADGSANSASDLRNSARARREAAKAAARDRRTASSTKDMLDRAMKRNGIGSLDLQDFDLSGDWEKKFSGTNIEREAFRQAVEAAQAEKAAQDTIAQDTAARQKADEARLAYEEEMKKKGIELGQAQDQLQALNTHTGLLQTIAKNTTDMGAA